MLGLLPGGDHIHYVLQRRAGGLADLGRDCDTKIDDWRLMMGHLRTAAIDVDGATLVEVGTGWYPTFPVCFYLAGATHIYTYDVARHLRSDLTQLLVDRLGVHVALIARESRKPAADISARLCDVTRALRRGATLGEATGGVVDYRAPATASETGLQADAVDVVFSNSVLEHVPPAVIEACFTEATRVLRPGGIMIHSVNCGDHYAYIDRSINQLNYLQFSDAAWDRWNNPFLYQNRLRAVDFTAMATRSGFEIEVDTSRASPERLAQLDGARRAPEFARYTREQLAITSIDFIARKANARTDRAGEHC